MRASAAAVAAALMVASPSSGTGAGADQAATPAPGGGSAGSIQAGQWEMRARFISIEAPGAPAEVQEQIRAQVARTDTSRTCITAEQAADPLREIQRSARTMPGQTCEIAESVFAGGAIRLRMTCQAAGEILSSTQISMVGSFSATAIDATLSVNVENPPATPAAQPQAIRMTTSIAGRRIGDCPPSAPAPVREN